MDNKKARIAQKDVKILVLPLFEGLYMDDLLLYAETQQNGIALKALPDDRKETLKFPRAYLINVINTICGDLFARWTKDRI